MCRDECHVSYPPSGYSLFMIGNVSVTVKWIAINRKDFYSFILTKNLHNCYGLYSLCLQPIVDRKQDKSISNEDWVNIQEEVYGSSL